MLCLLLLPTLLNHAIINLNDIILHERMMKEVAGVANIHDGLLPDSYYPQFLVGLKLHSTHSSVLEQ